MLHLRSSEGIHLITESLYHFIIISHFPFAPSSGLWQLPFSSVSINWTFKKFHIYMISYTICLCLAHFTYHNSLLLHRCCCKCQDSLLFLNAYLFILRERECVCAIRGGADKVGERESQVGSVLPAQSQTWGTISWTSWDHNLSWNQE